MKPKEVSMLTTIGAQQRVVQMIKYIEKLVE